jgi:hypothetical protein
MIAPITNVDQVTELWMKTYNAEGKPDWSHILPYYTDDIHFKDTVQELRGIDDFREMTIIFKKRPSSVLYGMSRLTLDDKGKIAEQRDYYDLWGDIFDNIPFFAKSYRKFMRKKFG